MISSGNLSLVVLDLDLFKTINDTYGHQTGDLILKNIASIMQDNIREGDLVCRTGGEEFTIIMPGTSLDKGYQVAERLRQAVEVLDLTSYGLNRTITVSIGLASYPENTDNILQLPQLADEAMYSVKREGRNAVATCTKDNRSTGARDSSLYN